MQNFGRLITVCAATGMLVACSSSKPDVEVSASRNQYWGSIVFDIQAVNDKATVLNVVINRGNCELGKETAKELSQKVELKFGQAYRGYSPTCSYNNLKEIQVKTTTGTFVFTFD